MTKNNTKKTLLSSILALVLCLAMLFGTTFAWFTDEIVNTNNIIKTGKLEIGFYYADKVGNAIGEWKTLDTADDDYDENTKVFGYGNWEPGYTEVKFVNIKNEGTLALKYKLNIVPDAISATAIELADVIDVYYIPVTDTENFTVDTRELLASYTPVGTLASLIADGDGAAYGILLPADEDDAADVKLNDADVDKAVKGEVTACLVLKMQETAGNEYQETQVGQAGGFNLQLLATQYTYENDSFDNMYDGNSPFSEWNGIVPAEMPASLVVDGATQTVHVKDAAAFAYLSTLSEKWADFYTDGNGRTLSNYVNGKGAEYYYSAKWTVSLEADIDLGNYPIEPVMIVLGESTGFSAFNGNNRVIRNINTTTGLFADSNRCTYSNLGLMNVKATNGALTGSSNTSINNVNVKNATISGVDYVGGLVGYIYGNVTNCEVIDSTVTGTKEVGGLIGYIATSSEGKVTGNKVKNITAYADNRAAGLVAQVNVNVKVFDNIIDTVTVGAEDISLYRPDAVVSNALAPENVYDNTVINATVLGDFAMVENNNELKDALNEATNGYVIYLAAGEYSLSTLKDKEEISIIGAEGTVIGGGSVSDGFGGNFGKDTTIKNITFSGTSTGARYTYAQGGTLVFENCAFLGNDRGGFHIDESKGATIIFNNCTLSGFNAFAGDSKKVVLNGCTLTNNGKYNGLNMYCDLELNNCKFEFTGKGSEFVDFESAGKSLTITNCTATMNGVAMDLADMIGGTYISQTTITIDGVPVVK